MRLPRWLARRFSKPGSERERIFRAIHESNAWGSEESRSGPGSTKDRGADFVDDLLSVLDGLACRTLLDVPCGDFNWISPVAERMDQYIGADIVPALVTRNRELYGSGRVRFITLDLVTDPLPEADAILSRDCLVHLTLVDIGRCLENVRRSRAKYFVTTTFVGPRDNGDIPTGSWRPLNLERPPFSLPPALHLIDERCLHTGGIYADKRLGVWRIADLLSRTG
ncbi:MAG TPA: class I SAM-dependent methyltransferase [Candidatus Bathyarchaeia archaeon]|nr:class I SAM-dependent methyltransferase [Candidatus Bathyarchaeia archaeon]